MFKKKIVVHEVWTDGSKAKGSFCLCVTRKQYKKAIEQLSTIGRIVMCDNRKEMILLRG